MLTPNRLAATAALVVLVFHTSAARAGDADAAVLEKIAAVRALADAIAIDGAAGDWKGIPGRDDPAGDSHRGADIRRVAIAPRATDLAVCVWTATPAPDATLTVDVDVAGDLACEARLLVRAGGVSRVGDRGAQTAVDGAEVVFGEVIELRVPLAAIGVDAPRSWAHVSIRAESDVAENERVVSDHADGIASFVLRESPVLDPPLPREGEPGRTLRLPVRGLWFVMGGPFEGERHREQWAWDLYPHGKPDPAVRAPGVYEVLRAAASTTPGAAGASATLGVGWGWELTFGDLARLDVGDGHWPVDDAPIGAAGDDGCGPSAHLHLSLARAWRGEKSIAPLAFARVRVALNPEPDDPWARTLESWVPRPGFYVARAEPEAKVTDPIQFYHQRDLYGCFSNFSAHPVQIDGETWPTSEHYYQAMKFPHEPERQKRIRAAKGPMDAKKIAWEESARLRADWDDYRVEVMRVVLEAKLRQHADIEAVLLSTGERTLVEHTKNDRFWADGGDGSGQNMLGKLLMELRAKLRAEKAE